jgi:hypothetical protein
MVTLKKIVILVFMPFFYTNCALVGPSIPTYEASYEGVCEKIELVDADGKLFPSIGIRTVNNDLVVFVEKNSKYSFGGKYEKYLGQHIKITGRVGVHDANMIKCESGYIGLPGWKERMNKLRKVNGFKIIKVEKVEI